MKKSTLTIAILLSISGLFAQSRMVIKQSTTNHEVIIKASDYSFIEHTHADVKDGKLSIYMDKKAPQRKTDIRIEIRLPHLEELSLSGPGDVTVEKRNEPHLTVINMGAGDCTLQCLKIEKALELHSKGPGDIIVPVSDAIKQETLLINNSGAGDVKIMASSTSGSLVVNNIGPGDVSVNLMSIPTEELILQNRGAGDIKMQNITAKRIELPNQGPGDMMLMNGKAEEMTL